MEITNALSNNQEAAVITIACVFSVSVVFFLYTVYVMLNPKRRQRLTVSFYQRVVYISNNIEKGMNEIDMDMIIRCQNRIDNDPDFSHPHAKVVRQMLLSDINRAKQVISLLTQKGTVKYVDN